MRATDTCGPLTRAGNGTLCKDVEKMKRVFLAIDIPDQARHAAAAHTEKLRSQFGNVRVSWVRPENMHITLRFLGDTSDERIEQISTGFRRIAADTEVFDAALDKPVAFGRRTLVIGVNDVSGCFAELGRLIETACRKFGLAAETRPFRPHLTVGRIRDQKNTGSLISAHRNARIAPVRFKVSSVVVYESLLGSTGSVYSPIGRLPLAPAT